MDKADKAPFAQNRIAVIWDFDKTLAPHYMQKPLFEAYGIDEKQFWRELDALPAYYARAGVNVQADTCYLGHILSYVQAGKMPDLTNRRLRELGAEIELYPGLPELFDRLRGEVRNDARYVELDLGIEIYVVSCGLREMILGSKISRHLDGVWASEFIEVPAGPGADFGQTPPSGPISQIAGFLDNTTKTRALFEINKGVNKHKGISVNDKIPESDRRVPFKNMIYVADGPSDIPSFSVVRKNGGLTLAVYDPKSPGQFAQVDELMKSERVDMTGPADYRDGSHTDMWLRLQIRGIADRLVEEHELALTNRVRKGPVHIQDKD